jgi:hypothetical protein
MTWGSRSELPSLSLAVFAGVLYTLVLHVLTVVIVPSPNHWWLDRWSIPIALAASVGVFLIASLSRLVFISLVNITFCLAGLAGYFIGSKCSPAVVASGGERNRCVTRHGWHGERGQGCGAGYE